jgi:hypothetical protein
MRRPLGALIAFSLAVLAGPASAAEITRVATSGEPGNPFDIDISFRWERFNERASITREKAGGELPLGTIVEGDDLRFTRTRNAIVPRVGIGLWNDLEFHFEVPYVLGDDRTLRYGLVYDMPTGGVPPYSSIENNGIDANGRACADQDSTRAGIQCPLFPVAPSTTDYHGGRAGDFKAGLAWGIFNDRKDDTKPFWLVGLDITFPTATAYEPAKGRGTNWSSDFDVPAKPGPFGERIWKWDLYTTMSRRMGYVDPYVKAHVTTAFKSSTTYSNCKVAKELSTVSPTMPVKQMNDLAVPNCASWGAEAGAKLPWVAGLTFGTEIVPYEDPVESQRVALDFRVRADYTSAHRFFNELTDSTGKIHQTEGYLEMGALVGLYLRASKFVSLQTTASLATRSSHYLTGESLGKNGSTPALDPSGLTTDPAAMNPNFDWRYDAPGRRFRISEVSVFELSFAGVLQF